MNVRIAVCSSWPFMRFSMSAFAGTGCGARAMTRMWEAWTFSGEAGLSPFASTAGIFFVGITRCQPNCVFTGAETVLTSCLNATSSNSLTIWPCVNSPRSPPFSFEGHSELAFASSANFFASASPFRPSSCFASVLILASASSAFLAASALASASFLSCSSTFAGSTLIFEETSCSSSFWMRKLSLSSCRPRSLPNGDPFSMSSSSVLGAPGCDAIFLRRSSTLFLKSASESFTPFFSASLRSSVFWRNIEARRSPNALRASSTCSAGIWPLRAARSFSTSASRTPRVSFLPSTLTITAFLSTAFSAAFVSAGFCAAAAPSSFLPQPATASAATARVHMMRMFIGTPCC